MYPCDNSFFLLHPSPPSLTPFNFFHPSESSGRQCFCGTASEFESATTSDGCGSTYEYLCSGDSTVACGGFQAISIYEKTGATPAPTVVGTIDPAPPTPAPTVVGTIDPIPPTLPPNVPPTPSPADHSTPAPAPSSYAYEGCFVDSKSNRIMGSKTTMSTMSAEVRTRWTASRRNPRELKGESARPCGRPCSFPGHRNGDEALVLCLPFFICGGDQCSRVYAPNVS